MTKDSLVAEYHINTNGRGIPPKEWEVMDNKKFRQMSKKYSYLNGDFIDLQDFVFAAMNSRTGPIYIFYSKKTRKVLSGSVISKRNSFFVYFEPPIARVNVNSVVSVQTAYQVLFHKKFIEFDPIETPEKKKQMEVFKNLTPNDNPILLLYTLKEF